MAVDDGCSVGFGEVGLILCPVLRGGFIIRGSKSGGRWGLLLLEICGMMDDNEVYIL